MAEISSDKPVPTAKTLLTMLRAEFPVFAESRPLAIGIDKQLLAARPDIERKLLRVALGMHTHSVRYLKALQGATQRFDLSSVAVGEVTEEQRSLASQELLDRFKKRAEEEKAARAAKAAAEKQARAEQERAEKLGQLVSKFARK